MPITQQQIDAIKAAAAQVSSLTSNLVADAITPPPPPPPPPTTGLLPSRGSNIGSFALDNGLVDMIDSAKIPPPIPWTLPMPKSMNGVEPPPYNVSGGIGGYRRLHVWGHGGNYNMTHPIVDGDHITQVQPNLGTDPMLNVMARLKDYPLREGPRGRHLITPYAMWHGHTRVENGVIATGPQIPYAIGMTMDGVVMLALDDGSIKFDRKIVLKSYCYDFAYHFPRSDGFFWADDTGVGEVIKVDRRNNTQSVWCTGLGRCTSLREVNGVLFVTDDQGDKVWAVSTTTPNMKSVYVPMLAPFWVDYHSDNRLMIVTRQSCVNIEQTLLATFKQIMPSAQTAGLFGHDKGFIMGDVDRNGTFGKKDAVVVCRSHGSGNIDFWRFFADGTLMEPLFNYSSIKHGLGIATIGPVHFCQDAFGHYPWFTVHHPDYGALMVGGMNNVNPVLVAAHHPSDTWVPTDYNVIANRMADGRALLMYGTVTKVLDPNVPSMSAQVNGTGGGNLWNDHVGEMTPAAGLAFLRSGGIGSYPRPNFAGQNGCSLHLFLCYNSMRYARDGDPYIKQLLSFYGTNP